MPGSSSRADSIDYRFALRGRWLAGHLLVIGLAALFVRLGLWQLDRLEDVRAVNALAESRGSGPPVSLEDAFQSGAEDARWRRVVAEGAFRPDVEVVVRHRSLDGRPGAWLLTPLESDGGPAILVNRGWVPSPESAVAVPPEAAPPVGPVRVTGVLEPADASGGGGDGPARGADGRFVTDGVDVRRLQTSLRMKLAPLVLRLERQAPPQGPVPVRIPARGRGEGPHLSYAVQWFLFASIGLVGWPILIRRTAGERAPSTGLGPGAAERGG